MAKAKPNHLPNQLHFTWVRCFGNPYRIHVRMVQDHPDVPVHDHEFIELAMIVEGSCRHRSALGEQPAAAGDVFLFRPGAWHEYISTQNLCLYNCCFDPSLLGSELVWMMNDPFLGRLLWSLPLSPTQHGTAALHLEKAELAPAQKILSELGATSLSETPRFGEQVGLLVQLLTRVAHHLPSENPIEPRAKVHPAISTIIKLLDEQTAEPWTLPMLAEKVSLSPYYLCRVFGEIVGLTPINYLNRRRLELATRLLRRIPPMPVGEVGAAVGWADANYFTRRFTEKFGVTPSKYRTRFMSVEQGK